jgi:hypothetical protein
MSLNLGLGFPFLKLRISILKMKGSRMVYATKLLTTILFVAIYQRILYSI